MIEMLRSLIFIVLVACTPPKKPTVYAPRETTAEQPPAGEGDTQAPASEAPPEATAASPAPGPQETTPDPVRATTTAGGAAHCLHVGPERKAVRCYWSRQDCEGQIAFNKGLDDSNNVQECRAAAQVHCLKPADSGELCYPAIADCEQTLANMRKRNRKTSDCTMKTGP
jgi:hypothetical protein